MIDLKQYPKSFSLLLGFIKGWLTNLQKELLKGVDAKEYPPITDTLVEQTTNSLMNSNIRALYSFFDKEGIYVVVDRHMGKWIWKIPKDIVYEASTPFDFREDAEEAGFKEAFNKLEVSG